VLLFPHALDPAAGAPGMVRDIPDDEPGLIRHATLGEPFEVRCAA
jgi:hypothetical protein